jgi:Zn-dependent protease
VPWPHDGPPINPSESPAGRSDEPTHAARKSWLGRSGLAALGAIALIALTKLKTITMIVLPALKFLKLGKVLTTAGSMFVSVWFYSLAFGWSFAAGFVLLIFVHEMGHVFVAWRHGLPISAPIFIPFMGALIIAKAEAKSAWNAAVMGIGGPIAGSIGALACWWIYATTQNELFLGLAYVGFMINLFNLMPVFPLDGGWITGAVSPYLWLVGMIGLVAGFVTGYFRNPMIIILLISSLPRLWHGIRHGVAHGPDVLPASLDQKVKMGLAYLALAGALAWAMGETHKEWTPERKNQYFKQA